jgi:regulator of sigma E protease
VQDKLVVQKDKPFTLAWTRAGAPFEATIAQERFEKEDRYGQKILEFTFGARGAMSQVPGETVTYFVGPIEAARRAAARMWEMTDMMVVGVAKMIRGEVSIKALGGPIMIFDIAGKAAEEGAANYVLIMAIISINLALLNLLPVPALDGGHLMFILLEAVRRRPVSPGLREAANLVGVGLLVLLMVLVLVLDVTRYWDKLLDLLRA